MKLNIKMKKIYQHPCSVWVKVKTAILCSSGGHSSSGSFEDIGKTPGEW